jgi:hypothetical protein
MRLSCVSKKLNRIGLIVSRLVLNLNLSKNNFKKVFPMSFIKELWKFLRVRKKLWLLPIIIIMVVMGGLLILAAKSSVVAPFIYTLF